MTILIVLATILLIFDCLLLGLLILVQLPKKEAGVGMAFGGGAADALFGAGSGTALSQLTKYTATAFFVLVFLLSVLNNHARGGNASELKRQMEKINTTAPSTSGSTPTAPANNPASSATPVIPLTISSNTVTAPATSAPTTVAPTAPAPATNNPVQPK
jgi:preprotein translocase subunit SecG